MNIQPVDLKYKLIINKNVFSLSSAPSGWEEGLMNYKRSDKYFGLLRNYSMPMMFHTDGAFLLRKEFYSRGLNSEVAIQIETLNKSTWVYELLYKGALDFSTFSDGEIYVEINAMDKGISEKIKAYEDVEYSVVLTEENSIDVRIPGVGLIKKALSIITERSFVLDYQYYNFLTITGALNELDPAFLISKDVDRISNVAINGLGLTSDWFLEAQQNTSVNISGVVEGVVNLQTSDQTAYIELRDADNNLIGEIISLVGSEEKSFSTNFSLSFSLLANQVVYMVTRMTGGNTQFPSLVVSTGDFSITNSLVTPDTITKAIRPGKLFHELLLKMNDDLPITYRSFCLNSKWKNLVVTTAEAIRQIDRPEIKTSFSDFFESFNSVISIGFGVENNTPTIEEKSYWYKSSLRAVAVGDVKSLDLDLAIDYIYNTIQAGYKDNNYEADYGREEVNSLQSWTTPITRVQRDLKLISVYRADQFGIEEARTITSEDNSNKKDSKEDNSIFLVKIQNDLLDGAFNVEGSENYRPIDGISGLSQRQSYYNLDLTPKKNLLRHGAYMRSVLHQFEGEYIRFQSAKKNADLITIDLNNVRVAEKEPISISSLEEPLFLPYIVTIKTKLPNNAVALLDTNPTGVASFRYKNTEYFGFVIECSVNVPRNSEKEWTLLLSPEVNVKNLIR